MLTRHPVLLTFSVPLRYPSRPVTSRTNKAASILRALFQIPHPVSRLPATLMDLPASVANKRLIAGLNPLDATLTKNRGYILQANYLSLSSLSPAHSECNRGELATRNSSFATIRSPLDSSSFFSHPCALFCTNEKLNSFVFKQFRTLYKKPPGVGGPVIIFRFRALRISAHSAPLPFLFPPVISAPAPSGSGREIPRLLSAFRSKIPSGSGLSTFNVNSSPGPLPFPR